MLSIRTRAVSILAILIMVEGGAAQTPKPEHVPPLRTYEGAYYPGQQAPITAEGYGLRLKLVKTEQCPGKAAGFYCFTFQVVDKRGKVISKFRINDDSTEQVDEAHFVSGSRAVIIGRGILGVVNVVDLKRQEVVDTFLCFAPSISENEQLLAYQKFFPRFTGGYHVSAEYFVYDFTKPPQENRTHPSKEGPPDRFNVGWPVYPPGTADTTYDNVIKDEALVHSMISDGLFWLGGKHVFAFIDRWQSEDSVVIADVSRGIRQPKVTLNPIKRQDVINPNVIDRARNELCSMYFDSLMHVTDMYLPQDRPGVLRLQLNSAAGECVKQPMLDIPYEDPVAKTELLPGTSVEDARRKILPRPRP
jgi:hypothetical protein